mmetsp:Transcript_4515/g.19180  ORF Transcript_4515/g.19180 Transcript_4515/m.19180 type:complete len:573 (+) Transcript_4515:2467-4185(+)
MILRRAVKRVAHRHAARVHEQPPGHGCRLGQEDDGGVHVHADGRRGHRGLLHQTVDHGGGVQEEGAEHAVEEELDDRHHLLVQVRDEEPLDHGADHCLGLLLLRVARPPRLHGKVHQGDIRSGVRREASRGVRRRCRAHEHRVNAGDVVGCPKAQCRQRAGDVEAPAVGSSALGGRGGARVGHRHAEALRDRNAEGAAQARAAHVQGELAEAGADIHSHKPGVRAARRRRSGLLHGRQEAVLGHAGQAQRHGAWHTVRSGCICRACGHRWRLGGCVRGWGSGLSDLPPHHKGPLLQLLHEPRVEAHPQPREACVHARLSGPCVQRTGANLRCHGGGAGHVARAAVVGQPCRRCALHRGNVGGLVVVARPCAGEERPLGQSGPSRGGVPDLEARKVGVQNRGVERIAPSSAAAGAAAGVVAVPHLRSAQVQVGQRARVGSVAGDGDAREGKRESHVHTRHSAGRASSGPGAPIRIGRRRRSIGALGAVGESREPRPSAPGQRGQVRLRHAEVERAGGTERDLDARDGGVGRLAHSHPEVEGPWLREQRAKLGRPSAGAGRPVPGGGGGGPACC